MTQKMAKLIFDSLRGENLQIKIWPKVLAQKVVQVTEKLDSNDVQ
jgi:hypothetical protein